jgi:lipopolysaccharide export system permease protein
MQFLWKHVDDLMGKGLELSIIAELLIYASSKLVNLALPLAILLSSIMSIGNLAENYELTAMKSAGNSLIRILRPLIVFIAVVAIGAFYFANNVWPVANLKFKSLLYSVAEQRPAFNLSPGVFYNGIEGFSIRVKHKSEDGKELEDVLIYDHRRKDTGNRTVIRARKGVMEQTEDKRFLVLSLFEGYSYDEQLESGKKKNVFPHIKTHFEKDVLRMDLSSFEFSKASEDLFANSYDMMSLSQLDVAVDSIQQRIVRSEEDLVNYMQQSLIFHRDSLPFDAAPGFKSDYFYNKLTLVQQRRAISVARDIARKSKSYIERTLEDVSNKDKFIARHEIEWHRKFFFAFACIVLFFIGAPLGAIIRKGGLGLPSVFAIILFVVYYMITITGEKMAKTGALEPWIGMWISTIILLPLGFFLTWKAANDSAIMDKEAYSKLWNSLKNSIRNRKKLREDSATLP